MFTGGMNKLSKTDQQQILNIKKLEKKFKDEIVLRELDLSVNSGEISVIIGPNGSGKSVFLSCLNGILAYTGEITYGEGGSIINNRHDISSLIQEPIIDPELTGRQNLQFYQGLHPRGNDRWKQFVKDFNILEDLDKLVGNYSGGMRRKVELSIALSPDVPVYILDEPTNELDLNMVRRVHNILDEMRKNRKAVIMTSHSPLDMQIADRLIILNKGKVINDDTPANLLSNIPSVLRIRGILPNEGLLDK